MQRLYGETRLELRDNDDKAESRDRYCTVSTDGNL